MIYKMLLVDDEKFMVSYLKECVNWKELNVEIVACAQNGVQAIEKTTLFQPDIIISDIVMPEMQGLEFIKNIHSTYKDTKIIILSGHQNFEYAKEAMLYGVIDYIVKPSLPADIRSAVIKAIAVIDERRSSKVAYQEALNNLKSSMPDIKKSFIELISHEPKADFNINILEKSKMLNLDLSAKTLIALKVIFSGSNDVLPESIQHSAINGLEQALQEQFMCQVLFAAQAGSSYSGLVCVANCTSKDIYKAVDYYARCNTQFVLTACISEPCTNIQSLPKIFAGINRVLHLRRCGYNGILEYSQFTNENSSSANYTLSYNSLLNMISLHDSKKAVDEIGEMMKTAVDEGCSMGELRHCMRHFLKALDDLLHNNSSGLSVVLASAYISESDFHQLETLQEIKQRLVALSSQAISSLEIDEAEPYPHVVSLAIKYIRVHFKKNITVAELAEQLYLTPNYLSAIYKKATGTSISEFITVCRINEAKALMLKNNDLKNYEIADKVGYSDYEHFRKVFKKYVGMNPAQYKTTGGKE